MGLLLHLHLSPGWATPLWRLFRTNRLAKSEQTRQGQWKTASSQLFTCYTVGVLGRSALRQRKSISPFLYKTLLNHMRKGMDFNPITRKEQRLANTSAAPLIMDLPFKPLICYSPVAHWKEAWKGVSLYTKLEDSTEIVSSCTKHAGDVGPAEVLAFGRQNNQPLGPVLEAIVRPSKPQKLLPARGQVRQVRRKPRRTLAGRGKLYQPRFSLISLLWLMTQQIWGPHPRSSVGPTVKHQDLGDVMSTG